MLERLDAAERSAATSTEHQEAEDEEASAGSGTGLRQERVLRRLARAEVKGRRRLARRLIKTGFDIHQLLDINFWVVSYLFFIYYLVFYDQSDDIVEYIWVY